MNEELRNELLNYLVKRPYAEVYQLVAKVSQATCPKEKDTKKEKK